MSVINNVLKDLETRESRFTPIEITSVAQPEAAERDFKPYWLGGLLLLGLLLAAWYFLMERPQQAVVGQQPTEFTGEAQQVAETAPAPIVAEPVETAAALVSAPRNQIVGLQIREGEAEMRLEFALRDRVVAYLKDRGEDSFGYHLRDVGSEIVAPIMRDNPWVVSLALEARDGGIDVNFQTAPDILVETRQHLIDGEVLWAINLRQPEPPAEPVVQAQVVAAQSSEKDLSAAPDSPTPVEVAAPVAEKSIPQAQPAAPEVKVEIRSTNPDARSASQLDYAVELINSRRYADAEKLLRGLFDGAEDLNARQHLLALYSLQKRPEPFVRLTEESMARYPAEAVFKTEYARAMFQRKAYRGIIDLFAVEAPRDATQQALLAASYQRLDQHDDAVRHYRLALGEDAANAKNWVGLGISQEHSSDFADALASYRNAAKLGQLNSRLQAFVDQRSATLQQVLN